MMGGKCNQKAELAEPAAMLAPVLPGGAIELQIKAQRGVGGTGTAIVNRAGFREEYDLLSRLVEAVAPIHIFTVHKKLRIQQADSLHRAPAENKKPAVQHLHRSCRSMVEVRHQQPPEGTRALEQRIEQKGSAKIIPHSWEAHGRAPHLAVLRQHLRSHHAHAGMFREIADHGRDAIVEEFYV